MFYTMCYKNISHSGMLVLNLLSYALVVLIE